ncbi:unnamed protein product [Rotaria socialis]|uniref:Dynamin-type G domain-containing protein n=1 Tax=Rotaria socialis TaxID=392032 RepID=A0A821AXZ9_9BILA|nr:unnamed protein product [Rotaria socialis]CAF3446754.1 unnamed protein product [Rotaria socialis]CAF4582815.1 unnamed protein product [Rotaria socialis]CAF4638356.1 unnamed protein product [Rotaria socialis]
MNTFTDAYDEKIRPLMDKIDQARSLLSSNDDGITLPNVVVVGDQSSGKSTLLEALSLVELPKGSGIVTRCPLVLRLRKSNVRRLYRVNDTNKTLLDEKTTNVLKYIEEETRKLAGNNKNVVKDLIELQVDDPNVRDLTVVDLPGIARNPIADQPKDIHKQTTDLIRHFIRQEGSVILCVFPANVDIATVESFTIARECDPTGERTIGVITKSDLAANHDILIQQLLMDRADVLHLKLGFIAVRNRSTEENISLEDARKREKEFFSQHPASSIAGHCLGIHSLINRLADLYSDRVKETFPKMRAEVQKKLKDVREQLSKFPPDLGSTSARLAKYYELADWYAENIIGMRFKSSDDGQQKSMINKLHHKLKQVQEIMERKDADLFSPSYRSKVKEAMSACFGEQLPNFLPHPVLKQFICKKLDQLWVVIDVLIKESFRMTCQLLLENDKDACKDDILLLKLLPTFRQVTYAYLTKKQQTICDQLQELLRIEKIEPYTLNDVYMTKINKFKEHVAKCKSSNTGEAKHSPGTHKYDDDDDDESVYDAISNDDQAVQDMIISIYWYWKVLFKRYMDYAALSVRAGCVLDTCSGIRECLRQTPVEQPTYVDAVLAEDTYVRAQREQLQQKQVRLEKVDAILGGGRMPIGDDVTLVSGATLLENSPLMTLDKLAESMTLSREINTTSPSTPASTSTTSS